jgi:hypothetical protein
MSSSPNLASVAQPLRVLRIDVGVPTIEIFVLDGASVIVARGIGSVEATLPLGMYKIRLRLGATVADGYFELPEGLGEFTPPNLPALPIVTPVPLLSQTGHNLDSSLSSADLAMTWSIATDISVGQGSSLFLFVDCATVPQGALIAADAVTVTTFTGKVLASLTNGNADRGCFGCSIALAPGAYVLTVAQGSLGTVSQAVYCAAGWQTEVFLPVVQDQTSGTLIDPSAASIMMSPSQIGFRAESKSALWAEAARKTLASGRPNVTPVSTLRGMPSIGPDDPMIEGMLYGKFLNPMLGLYGAHLMAIQKSPDNLDVLLPDNKDVLLEVVPNLRKLLGDIPDVMALVLQLDPSSAAGLQLPIPPMLASSWAMIVRASVAEPAIVPVDSPAAQISGRVWGTGAWLGWKAEDVQPIVDAASSTVNALGMLGVDMFTPSVPPAVAEGAAIVAMTPAERAVLQYVTARNRRYSPLVNVPQTPAPSLTDTDPAVVEDMVAAMTPATGIPSSVLRMAAVSLSRKLKGTP